MMCEHSTTTTAAELAHLRATILFLSNDPSLDILTGPGLRLALTERCEPGTCYDIICLDIDHMKALNTAYGDYSGTNALIRGGLLVVREEDLVIGKHMEGDEIVIITRAGDGVGCARRLLQSFRAQRIDPAMLLRILAASDGARCGLSATAVVTQCVAGAGVIEAIGEGFRRVLRAKAEGKRGAVTMG